MTAPQVGFEPTTRSLTGSRSTAELLRNVFNAYSYSFDAVTVEYDFILLEIRIISRINQLRRN